MPHMVRKKKHTFQDQLEKPEKNAWAAIRSGWFHKDIRADIQKEQREEFFFRQGGFQYTCVPRCLPA